MWEMIALDLMKLSKELSYALRHSPWEYELELDEEGWVEISQLLVALHESPQWKGVTQVDLEQMIQASEKKRHEIRSGRIRALYGHSTPIRYQSYLLSHRKLCTMGPRHAQCILLWNMAYSHGKGNMYICPQISIRPIRWDEDGMISLSF